MTQKISPIMGPEPVTLPPLHFLDPAVAAIREAAPRMKLAYPDMCAFRRDPDHAPCRGKGYCPRDISCDD